MDTRICKDCKHYRGPMRSGDGKIMHMCARRGTRIDLVTGDQVEETESCYGQRSLKIGNSCGPEGLHFQPLRE